MKRSLHAGISAFFLLASFQEMHGWTGDSWGSTTRSQIQAIADEMIDSTWTPKSTFNNYQYTSNGSPVYQTYYNGTTYKGIAYGQASTQDDWTSSSIGWESPHLVTSSMGTTAPDF